MSPRLGIPEGALAKGCRRDHRLIDGPHRSGVINGRVPLEPGARIPRLRGPAGAAWSPRCSATRIAAGTGVVPRRVACIAVGTIDGATARAGAGPGVVSRTVSVCRIARVVQVVDRARES